MSVPILDIAATYMCPHGGRATIVTTNTRVKAQGRFLLLMSDVFTIVGCPFMLPTVPPTPSPCIIIQWLNGSTRLKVMGTPVLLQSSAGLCISATGIPQGTPIIIGTQNSASSI